VKENLKERKLKKERKLAVRDPGGDRSKRVSQLKDFAWQFLPSALTG